MFLVASKYGRVCQIFLRKLFFVLTSNLRVPILIQIESDQFQVRARFCMAMSNVLKRLGYIETVHGMRSTFRDWVGDQTGYPEVLAELALAHRVGDETERAYRRGDALERRRELMLAWDRFLEGEEVVVQIKEIAGRK